MSRHSGICPDACTTWTVIAWCLEVIVSPELELTAIRGNVKLDIQLGLLQWEWGCPHIWHHILTFGSFAGPSTWVMIVGDPSRPKIPTPFPWGDVFTSPESIFSTCGLFSGDPWPFILGDSFTIGAATGTSTAVVPAIVLSWWRRVTHSCLFSSAALVTSFGIPPVMYRLYQCQWQYKQIWSRQVWQTCLTERSSPNIRCLGVSDQKWIDSHSQPNSWVFQFLIVAYLLSTLAISLWQTGAHQFSTCRQLQTCTWSPWFGRGNVVYTHTAIFTLISASIGHFNSTNLVFLASVLANSEHEKAQRGSCL